MIIFAKKEVPMRTVGYQKKIEDLLKGSGPLSVADFVAVWSGVPMPTVYSRIRGLLREGRLSPAGRGLYLAVHKPRYEVPISEWMYTVNDWLIDGCVGINCCLHEAGGNLYVETYKGDIPQVLECLKRYSPKVICKKDEESFPTVLEGYIIVGALVSDAPVMVDEDISVPTLEKTLIDNLIRKRGDEKERQLAFQKAMEVYPVNINRMKRYAARRGVKEELSTSLASLDARRLDMFSATQKYLAGIPVLRAWVFGSFARGEETPESDLDLLVEYDHSSSVSLLDIIRYKKNLEKLIGREVDLVENGYLKPFALPSAEQDKYLVYER